MLGRTSQGTIGSHRESRWCSNFPTACWSHHWGASFGRRSLRLPISSNWQLAQLACWKLTVNLPIQLSWLVVWNIGMMIQSDELIFFRGVGIPTTSFPFLGPMAQLSKAERGKFDRLKGLLDEFPHFWQVLLQGRACGPCGFGISENCENFKLFVFKPGLCSNQDWSLYSRLSLSRFTWLYRYIAVYIYTDYILDDYGNVYHVWLLIHLIFLSSPSILS